MVERLRAARSFGPLAVAVGMFVGVDMAGGCTSFQTADVGDASTSSGGGGIRCGNGRCAPPDVCCFEADAGTASCTTKASCTGAPLECNTTVECVDAGKPAGTVCCGYNDRSRLLRSACVQGSACDARGPQDWLCDPTLAAGSECIEPTRTACKGYPFRAPDGFALCEAP